MIISQKIWVARDCCDALTYGLVRDEPLSLYVPWAFLNYRQIAVLDNLEGLVAVATANTFCHAASLQSVSVYIRWTQQYVLLEIQTTFLSSVVLTLL